MSSVTRLAAAFALACAASTARAEEPQAPQRPMHPRLEQMRESQKKLDDLVAKMNAATGEAKVEAIAAVVTELVVQRRAMMPMGHPMGGRGMGPPGPEQPAQ
jgi:hypothetical protein